MTFLLISIRGIQYLLRGADDMVRAGEKLEARVFEVDEPVSPEKAFGGKAMISMYRTHPFFSLRWGGEPEGAFILVPFSRRLPEELQWLGARPLSERVCGYPHR